MGHLAPLISQMTAYPKVVTEALEAASAHYDKLSTPQKYAVGITGGILTLGMINKVITAIGGYKIKPSSFEITGGAIDSKKVKAEFDAYTDNFGKDPGQGILDR